MNNEFIRNYVKNEVLFTAEAAEELGVSRQMINTLVAGRKLKTLKRSGPGTLFLKEDLEKFRLHKYKKTAVAKQEIYGNNNEKKAWDVYVQKLHSERNHIMAVYIYHDSFEAALDGYFSIDTEYNWEEAKGIETPTLVILHENGVEYWFTGLLCGYRGNGPDITADLLWDIEINEGMIEELYLSRWIKYIRKDNGWECSHEYRSIHQTEKNKEQYRELKGLTICSFKNHLALLQSTVEKNVLEEGAMYFLNSYFRFASNPVAITLYFEQKAVETGHYICSTCYETLYQAVIKDKSGRELWLIVNVEELDLKKEQTLIQQLFEIYGVDWMRVNPELLNWVNQLMDIKPLIYKSIINFGELKGEGKRK